MPLYIGSAAAVKHRSYWLHCRKRGAKLLSTHGDQITCKLGNNSTGNLRYLMYYTVGTWDPEYSHSSQPTYTHQLSQALPSSKQGPVRRRQECESSGKIQIVFMASGVLLFFYPSDDICSQWRRRRKEKDIKEKSLRTAKSIQWAHCITFSWSQASSYIGIVLFPHDCHCMHASVLKMRRCCFVGTSKDLESKGKGRWFVMNIFPTKVKHFDLSKTKRLCDY